MNFGRDMLETLGTARDSWLDALGLGNNGGIDMLAGMGGQGAPNFDWLGGFGQQAGGQGDWLSSMQPKPELPSVLDVMNLIDPWAKRLTDKKQGKDILTSQKKKVTLGATVPKVNPGKPRTTLDAVGPKIDSGMGKVTTPTVPAPAAPAPVSGGGAGVLRWKPLVSETAAKYGVPQDVALGIMEIESGGNPEAQGAKTQWGKAQGLMQVMPFHWSPGTPEQVMRDPVENIDKGMQILKRGFDRFGDWEKAAAAYFGAVDANGNITDASDGNTTGSVYVRKFNEARSKYFAPEEE